MLITRLRAVGLSAVLLAGLPSATLSAHSPSAAVAKTCNDAPVGTPSARGLGRSPENAPLAASAASTSGPSVSLSTARQKAAHEGKLLLVDFWASYCLPCRMMDETTFADPRVLDYLREHYVSIKIDVQNFDGLAIQQQYGVGELPTMLLFSSTGEELDRIEGTITAAEMLVRLRKNDQPAHRTARPGVEPVADWTEPFAKMSNAYAEAEETEPTEAAEEDEAEAVLAQAPTTDEPTGERILATAPTLEAAIAMSPTRPTDPESPSVPAATTKPAPAATAAAFPIYSRAIYSLQLGVFSDLANAHRRAAPAAARTAAAFPIYSRAIYSLQLGVFSDLANAHRMAETAESMTDADVVIERDGSDPDGLYRVLAGRFPTRAQAAALREVLSPRGLDGFAMAR